MRYNFDMKWHFAVTRTEMPVFDHFWSKFSCASFLAALLLFKWIFWPFLLNKHWKHIKYQITRKNRSNFCTNDIFVYLPYLWPFLAKKCLFWPKNSTSGGPIKLLMKQKKLWNSLFYKIALRNPLEHFALSCYSQIRNVCTLLIWL